MKTLPRFIEEMLTSPPHAGEGVHNWLFRVARQLHAHLPAVEIIALLEERTHNCGRHVSLKEIEDAVRNSLSSAWQPSGKGATSMPAVRTPKWPALNSERREAVIQQGGGLADLWELSNPRFEDGESKTEAIIDWIFPDNPLLCCGKSTTHFDTRTREEWRGELSSLQFIVPSPMSAVEGKAKDGHSSRHTLDNTGPRRFLICEFDGKKWKDLSDTERARYGSEQDYIAGNLDEQAAVLLHLGTYAPLVLTLHSGGKSLHGWFYVHGQPADIVERFFRYAVSLGADHMTWTRSQFVRMPDGMRDDSKRQTVYFINLNPMEHQK